MVSSKFLKDENKHLFSFFFQELSLQQLVIGKLISIESSDFFHRLIHVVRLGLQDVCILFDRDTHVLVKLVVKDKKSVTFQIDEINKNQEITPNIIFLLPVLKREALETAVYSLAEMGINQIQLVTTEKSRQLQFKQKDIQRLEKIIIAAAEQSKAYRFPTISSEVVDLSELLQNLDKNSDRVLFDIHGESFFELRKKAKYDKIYLSLGPEGGLTTKDREFFKEHDFVICSLTSTVLRSLQAVAVGSALFRIKQ